MLDTAISSVSNTQNSTYDVIIIGGGPAGLSAAIYAARAGLNTLVLDKNSTAGALSMTHQMENYPGVPQAVSGEELLSRFHQQAEGFGAKIVQTQVFGVNLAKETKEVMTSEQSYQGKTVIIATGSMGHKPRLKGEADFIGRGVSYCAICDAAFYKRQTIAVIGEPPEAITELAVLAKFAGKIYLFLKGRVPSAEQMETIRSLPNVQVMEGQSIANIFGSDFVESITVTNANNDKEVLDVSGVFVYLHGNLPIVDFLGQSIELTQQGYIKADRTDMSTSIEGVYAIGDVVAQEIRQVVIAAAEGCIAALSVDQYINQRQKVRSQWS